MQRISAFLLALVLLHSGARAQFEIPGISESTTRAEMVSETRNISPGGTFTVAVKLDHPDKWHSYYKNSGGIEQSPDIAWTLPEGFLAGPIQWPTPEVKDGFFGKSLVYFGSPVFLVDIQAPASLQGESVTLTAHASWQICEQGCINEEKKFTLVLPVAATMEKDPARIDLFEKARAALPETAKGWTFTADSDGGDIRLRVIPEASFKEDLVDFVPDQPFVLPVSAGGSIERDGSGWKLTLKRATKDATEAEIPQGASFSGILTGKRPVAMPATVISNPGVVGGKAAVAKPAPLLSLADFLPVLGGMFLGGLILNLMPCVFPVIGLKIMGFVQQAGADRRKIALHGITFTLGVLASFAVLSGILFAFRTTTGWGYQLQNPWVVLTLMLLMFVLALNMFGVFEMGASATSVGGSLQSKHGLAGSFFSGILATVVATPCSGPFLGAAIGAAFGLPALQFFLAFAAMAIGLALPYLVLSVFPGLVDHLPRPGAWMESFKQAMSFLLFGTTGYLLWVYSGLIDADNLLGPVFGLTCIAIALWIHGRWNLPHRTARTRAIAAVVALAFAAGGVFLSMPPKPSALVWEPWSEKRVESALKGNHPVFIDFTAKWCATCQVNKTRAYDKEVVAMMHKKGVITLKADKTKPNEEIEAALNQLGRTAIPVNVLIAPGRNPVIFPELLTPEVLLGPLKSLPDR
jgi:thiol:disulfide interchange protein